MRHVTTVASTAAAAILLYRLYKRMGCKHALKATVDAFFASKDEDGAGCLCTLAEVAGTTMTSAEFARALDAVEPLHQLRELFHIPPHAHGEQAYMAGNSLGLEPKATQAAVQGELIKWGERGVMGHFEGTLPWATCEDALPELLGDMVGAKNPALEVGAMNSLTINLHLLMAAFYRPTDNRAAILIEAGAFPSDRYAVGSQIRHWGRDPDEWLIEVQPREDGLLHTDDIIGAIRKNEARLALVLLGGVNYLTGQVLDMEVIAAHMAKRNTAAKASGRPPIPFGLDLAHAIGNVPLSLHEWNVDFAAWCTYKYLNSGAGCLAGMFVHEIHACDSNVYPRLSGWWGVPFSKRFAMAHKYDEASGAPGFGVSNVNPLMVACVHASLQLFQRAGGVHTLRRKSMLLTTYLELLLRKKGLLCESAEGSRLASGSRPPLLKLVTPSDPKRRGCQLSLRVGGRPGLTMRALEEALRHRGVVGDAREPDVIRISPVPLYNSFTDVHRAVAALQDALATYI
jgi:kynureninase